jgi:predicted dehydrogenase
MPAIRGVPEVRASVVLDLNPVRARGFAERFGFPKWTVDLGEFAESADLAIVALPNGAHASVSIPLLSRGIHVLCEKPMARNTAECQSMINAASQGHALLSVGHNRRFRNHLRLAKRLLQKNLIGNILQVEAEEGSSADWPRSAAYFDPAESGGGALMDVGIHSIDLIRWLAGNFLSVGYLGNGTAQSVESESEVRFELSAGAKGKIVSSRTRNLRQQLTITGSHGFIQAGLWGDNLRIRSDNGKAFRFLPHVDAFVSRRPPADSSFVDQLFQFVQAIRGKGTVLVNGEEGKAAVEVVCRAYAHPLPSTLAQSGAGVAS